MKCQILPNRISSAGITSTTGTIQNYLSFGPSAHSFWKNERWWNVSNIAEYIEQLQNHRLPLSGGEHLSETTLMEEAIFSRFTKRRNRPRRIRLRFARESFDRKSSSISSLIQKGLARMDNGIFRLTAKGYLVCDDICQSFP